MTAYGGAAPDASSSYVSVQQVEDVFQGILNGNLSRPKQNEKIQVFQARASLPAHPPSGRRGDQTATSRRERVHGDTLASTRGTASSLCQTRDTAATTCSLSLPHAFDVSKIDYESFEPASGLRRDDGYYNCPERRANMQLDAEGRPMMHRVVTNKYARDQPDVRAWEPRPIPDWRTLLNPPFYAKQTEDLVLQEPLMTCLLKNSYSFDKPNAEEVLRRAQRELDHETRFGRDMNPRALRLSSQTCTTRTVPFDFQKAVPLHSIDMLGSGALRPPSTASKAPPRSASASLISGMPSERRAKELCV
jgi:hypothetical protein